MIPSEDRETLLHQKIVISKEVIRNEINKEERNVMIVYFSLKNDACLCYFIILHR